MKLRSVSTSVKITTTYLWKEIAHIFRNGFLQKPVKSQKKEEKRIHIPLGKPINWTHTLSFHTFLHQTVRIFSTFCNTNFFLLKFFPCQIFFTAGQFSSVYFIFTEWSPTKFWSVLNQLNQPNIPVELVGIAGSPMPWKPKPA